MQKKQHLEIINNFVNAYKLLIICLNLVDKEKDISIKNNLLKEQISTTNLIKNYEDLIIQKQLNDEAFLTLKKELNDCTKAFVKFQSTHAYSLSYIRNKLSELRQVYLSYV